MTPEEQFNLHVWQVLQRIKNAALLTVEGQPIEYELTRVVAAGHTPRETERRILFKLQEWDVLTIQNTQVSQQPLPTAYLLRLQQADFDRTYDKYQKACDPDSYLNDFQQKVKQSRAEQGAVSPAKWLQVETSDVDTKSLATALQRRYDFFTPLSDREFFLGLVDYMKFIADNPLLDRLAMIFIQEREADTEKLNQLEETAISELKATGEALKQRLSENDLDSQYSGFIQEYEGYLSGHIQSSAPLPVNLHNEISDVVYALFRDRHEPLIAEFVKIDREANIPIEYVISDSYPAYNKERERFKERQLLSDWNAWNELVLAYVAAAKYHEEAEKMSMDTDFFKIFNLAGLKGEMNQVLGLSSGNLFIAHFKKDRYVHFAHKVHNRLIEMLTLMQDMRNFDANVTAKHEPSTASLTRTVGDRQPNTEHDIELNGLKLSCTAAKLQFQDNAPVPISPSSQPIKLLRLLLTKEQVVTYLEVAEELNINSYHSEATNNDVARDVQLIMRDLKALLRDGVGMSDDTLRKLFRNVRDVGYTVNR